MSQQEDRYKIIYLEDMVKQSSCCVTLATTTHKTGAANPSVDTHIYKHEK